MIILGNNIIIYENGVAIAAAKSCEIQVECDALEVSSPDSSDWRDYIAGRKGWTVKINSLVSNVMEKLKHPGAKVRLTMGVRDANNELTADRLTGYALCRQAIVTGTVGNLAQGSWSFLGKGELDRVMLNLRDSLQRDLKDSNGNQLRVMESLENLV